MTDQPAPLTPEPPSAIDVPLPPPLEPPVATPAKRGGVRAVIVVGLIVAFLAVVLYMVKDSGAADDLKVGDCFDIPTASEIKTVTHHPCIEAHTGEVFHVVEFSGSDMTTPLSFVIENFADTTCTPIFATYTGVAFDDAPDLTFGWFYPTVESWQGGDRTITCYITRVDHAAMTSSVKAGAQ